MIAALRLMALGSWDPDRKSDAAPGPTDLATRHIQGPATHGRHFLCPLHVRDHALDRRLFQASVLAMFGGLVHGSFNYARLNPQT